MNKESLHTTETAEGKPNTTKKSSEIMQRIGRCIYHLLTGEITKSEAIHPDFLKKWDVEDANGNHITWFQNRDWGPFPEPKFKIGFYINDLTKLDNCPWIGKIGNNIDSAHSEFKYYFVGFGDIRKFQENYGIDEMIEWAKQFDHPSLMKYNGKLIRMIDQKDQES